MIYNERDVRKESVLEAARQIMVAARTAPKGKGVDVIEVMTITDDEIVRLSEEMRKVHEENGFKFFLRDADNILQAEAVVLIGTNEHCQGMNSYAAASSTSFLGLRPLFAFGLGSSSGVCTSACC